MRGARRLRLLRRKEVSAMTLMAMISLLAGLTIAALIVARTPARHR
jgi:hypothetical protein